MQSSVESEIFNIFQHKVEWVPHFARVSEVKHIFESDLNGAGIRSHEAIATLQTQ